MLNDASILPADQLLALIAEKVARVNTALQQGGAYSEMEELIPYLAHLENRLKSVSEVEREALVAPLLQLRDNLDPLLTAFTAMKQQTAQQMQGLNTNMKAATAYAQSNNAVTPTASNEEDTSSS